MPPGAEPVSPVKSVSGRAWASQMNPSAAGLAAAWSASAPPGARYQERASVPEIGKLENELSKPGYGQPGCDEFPAPLSKRTRICGRASNADWAAPSVGC